MKHLFGRGYVVWDSMYMSSSGHYNYVIVHRTNQKGWHMRQGDFYQRWYTGGQLLN